MTRLIGLFLCCVSVFATPACKKSGPATRTTTRSSPTPAASRSTEGVAAEPIDACALLTREEVGAIEASPITDTKPSTRTSAGFVMTQCFYTAAEFSHSVNVTLTRRDPAADSRRGARDLWVDTFRRFSKLGGEREAEHDAPRGDRGEEEERSKPPLAIAGLGEEAFWLSGIGGTIYVLKGESFLRISVGGPSADETKLEKAKALAAKAIERL